MGALNKDMRTCIKNKNNTTSNLQRFHVLFLATVNTIAVFLTVKVTHVFLIVVFLSLFYFIYSFTEPDPSMHCAHHREAAYGSSHASETLVSFSVRPVGGDAHRTCSSHSAVSHIFGCLVFMSSLWCTAGSPARRMQWGRIVWRKKLESTTMQLICLLIVAKNRITNNTPMLQPTSLQSHMYYSIPHPQLPPSYIQVFISLCLHHPKTNSQIRF